ncbi:Tropomodulin-2 [Cichlidogyrus casuarinus]|uniref:Tropomodulin-2 n=1 Tax=Cichlidogyrus casuarinus TaxID=1844966 RepID=A0ABD2Q1F7_9PLAT
MSNKLLYGKTLESYDDDDIDDLLSKLTEAEIKELNEDLDPDNSLLPASQRCKNQTEKEPTGPFNREALIKFLIEHAKSDPDWEESVPFQKIIRGKVFVPKSQEEAAKQELADLGFDTEFDDDALEALQNASEEELVDLAAILGFTGMLNQVQYHAGVGGKQQSCGGFQGIAKAEPCKVFDPLPPNDTDVEESLKQLKADDEKLVSLNLNNIKTITADQFKDLAEAIGKNKHLKELHLASTGITQPLLDPLIDALKKNNTLRVLNLESNFIMGDQLVRLFEAVNRDDCSITEVHLANQRQQVLGVQTEQLLTDLICSNPRIIRLGVDFETQEARVRTREAVIGNMDRVTRIARVKT